MKRFLIALFAAFFLIGVLLWLFDFSLPKGLQKGPCVFCNSNVIEAQKIYENECAFVLYDWKPICQGHCLVIPKRHVERLEHLSEKEVQALYDLLKKTEIAARKTFGKKDYFILQKNGSSAGQTIPHLHIHFIPRGAEEKSLIAFLFRFCAHTLKSGLTKNEMDEARAKMGGNFTQTAEN